MPAVLLLIPFLLIRFGILRLANRTAVQRAAHFAPPMGREKTAYWVYQITNAAIFILPFILRIQTEAKAVFCTGMVLYTAGMLLLLVAVLNFAAPAENGMNQAGLYRISRNPMYVAYFLCFMGCALLTQSLLLFCAVLAFQIAAHWIILAEERWCLKQFGADYQRYMDRVRRYI